MISFIRYTLVTLVLAMVFLMYFVFPSEETKSFMDYGKQKVSFTYSALVYRMQNQELPVAPAGNLSRTLNVPVLLYHGLLIDGSIYSIDVSRFEDHIKSLYDSGYQSITLSQLNDFINNDKPLPEKSILITFDDGRRDSFLLADNILKKYHYSAVMFTPSSILNDTYFTSDYYIDRNLFNIMVDTGRWEIGSHGVQSEGGYVKIDENGTEGHFLSNRAWLEKDNRLETEIEYKDRVNYEISQSKIDIEKILDFPIIAFSYPFGDYGQESKNAKHISQETVLNSIKNNYKIAFQQVRPSRGSHVGNISVDSRYLLARIEPKNTILDLSGKDLIKLISAGQEKKLPYVTERMAFDDWKTSWGAHEINESYLTLKSKQETSGALTLLDGSLMWDDFSFSAVVDWKEGSHFLLLARVQNNLNYVQCSFGDEYLRIEQIVEGGVTILSEIKNELPFSGQDALFEIDVNKSNVKCIYNKQIVIESVIKDISLGRGGVGFKIWDQNNNGAEVLIKRVSVYEY